MVGLGSRAQFRLLQFHEIPHLRPAFDDRPRPQVRERADRTLRLQPAPFDHAAVQHRDAVAEHALDEPAVRADHAVFADDRPALQRGVRVNDGVETDPDLRVDEARLWLQERRAGLHQLPPHAVAQDPLGLGQLGPRVDAERLDRIPGDIRRHFPPLPDRRLDDVGEVVFLLCVGGFEPSQRRKQELAFDHVRARIDFGQPPLGRRGVPVFDDPPDRPVAPPHDPPVAGGLV